MALRFATLLLGAGLLSACLGCDPAKLFGGSEGDDKVESDKPSKGKKAKGSKKSAASAEATAQSGGDAPAPADGSGALATLFTGESEPGVVFIRMKPIAGKSATMGLPADWMADNSDPSLETLDGQQTMWDAHSHATVWVSIVKKLAEIDANSMKLNLQRVHVTGTPSFEGPVEGKLGASNLPAKLYHGSATVMARPGEVWYAVADYSSSESLVMFASLRSDVYPKLRAPLYSIIRSIKVNR